jgi:hypothetical protein
LAPCDADADADAELADDVVPPSVAVEVDVPRLNGAEPKARVSASSFPPGPTPPKTIS